MRAPSALLLGSLLVFAAPYAHAAAIPGLFDTGVDAARVPLPGGSVDPHWVLIASADGAYPGPASVVATVIPVGYWMPNSVTSSWIAPAPDENWPAFGTALAAGDYTYRLTFDLTGFVLGTVSISGAYGVDNSGIGLINGVQFIGPSTAYGSLVPFTITSGLVAGINHLDFTVTNWPASGSNPTGLRVGGLAGTGTATTGVTDADTAPGLRLLAPSPNPARAVSRLGFVLPRAGHARLQVLDAGGRLVRTLVDGSRAAGPNEAVWAGIDQQGANVAAGLYFVVLDAGDRRVSRRMVWMR